MVKHIYNHNCNHYVHENRYNSSTFPKEWTIRYPGRQGGEADPQKLIQRVEFETEKFMPCSI
jgi:hypothetical protein